MKIKLQEALDLIESADVVKVKHGDYYPHAEVFINPVNDSPDKEVLYLETREYAFRVCESGNAKVKRDGHKLTFKNDAGYPLELHLFKEVPILA